MATAKSTVEYILEQLSGLPAVSARAMFGEYALYCDGKVVALICDDQLFLKPIPAAEALVGDHAKGPPYPGAKPHIVVDAELLEDAPRLQALIAATAEALPKPKPKKPKAKATKTKA
jgi:DNA transformation protein and related proteins